jgi:transposase-like protein
MPRRGAIGETIDFTLAEAGRGCGKTFLQLVLWRTGQIRPRVINVDQHAAYPQAIAELKQTGELARPPVPMPACTLS